jgi:TRAP-type C4-dicarboxylate transport system permease large subunit
MKQPTIYVMATTALSLFTAGCLVILFVFVPMWQQLDPAAFLQWFADYGKTVGMVMLPLEMAPLMLSLVSYFRSRNEPNTRNSWLLLTNICNVIILLMFIVYFLPVNGAFIDGSMPLQEVPGALKYWQFFHTIRTAVSLLAVIFSALALTEKEVNTVAYR